MHWKPDPDLYPRYLRQRIRRGRGVREGKTYLPWLKVRDVPSRGTSSVVKGIVVDRTHHLLSELEATYFYLVERAAGVVDLQEQWPILDIDRTLELARQFGVRHPFKGTYPAPFTIDLLITELSGGERTYRAASIKTPEDAQDPSIRRRLAVENAWCQERGIPWALIDTKRFDKDVLSNLRFLRAWFLHRHEPDANRAARFADVFMSGYERNIPLSDLIARAARRLRMGDPLAQDLFRYCGWTDQIKVALTGQMALDQPLTLTHRASP